MKLSKWLWIGALLVTVPVSVASFMMASGMRFGLLAGLLYAQEKTVPSVGEPEVTTTRELRVVGFGRVDVEGGTVPLSMPVGGVVAEVLVREGEHVAADQPLIQIDDSEARLLLEQADAAVTQAEVHLANATRAQEQLSIKIQQQQQAIVAAEARLRGQQRRVDQLKPLIDTAVTPENYKAAEDLLAELQASLAVEQANFELLQLQQPENDMKQSRAALRAACAQRSLATERLRRHTLKAPCDGLILRAHGSRGQVTAPESPVPLIWFCPDQPRIVRCEIDQEFASRVQAGLEVEISTADASDGRWHGTVSRCADWIAHRRSLLDEPFERNDVRTLECIITLAADQPPLRIGQRMRVEIFGTKAGEGGGEQ